MSFDDSCPSEVAFPSSKEEWERIMLASMAAKTASSASAHLEKLLDSRRACMPLLTLMAESQEASVRQLAAVLLRGRLASYWGKLNKQQRQQLQRC